MNSFEGDARWYVRDRGRIEGPYTVDILRRMNQTRRLARHHQVSSDKISWHRASEALPPEVFGGRSAPPKTNAVDAELEPIDSDDSFVAPVTTISDGFDPPLTASLQRLNWSGFGPFFLGGLILLAIMGVVGLFVTMSLATQSGDQRILSKISPSLATLQGLHPAKGKKQCYGVIVSRQHVVAPILAATLQAIKVQAQHSDGSVSWHSAHLVLADPITKLCVLSAEFGSTVKYLDPPDVKQLPVKRESLRLLMPDLEDKRAIEWGTLARVINEDGPDEMLLVEFDYSKDAAEAPLGRAVTNTQGVLTAMVVERTPDGENLCVPVWEMRAKRKTAASLPPDHVMEPITLPESIPATPDASQGTMPMPDINAPPSRPQPTTPEDDASTNPAAASEPPGDSRETGKTMDGGRGETKSDSNGSPQELLQGITTSVIGAVDEALPELPPEKAKELGRDYLQQIVDEHRPSGDKARTAATRKLADTVIRAAGRKPRNYTVTVVEDDTVNAYAFVGNNILVNTGFLDFAQSDDEMIQFVLAHELGHIVRGHTDLPFRRKMLTDGLAAFGALAGDAVGTLLKNSPYNQAQEEDADCFAVTVLRALDKTPEGGVRFFRKLSQQESKDGDAGDDSLFNTLFSSHPNHARRIELLKRGCLH